MNLLHNKVAVVTGASSGIGRAIALAFAAEGAKVVVNYRQSEDRAKDVVAEIEAADGSAMAVAADMANTGAIHDLVSQTCRAYGAIDIWVNNAGADILTGTGAQQDRESKLQRLIDVDLKGTMNACWIVAPHMQAQGEGVIINMSWDQALHGFSGSNPQIFAATKAGVIGF
ncbi:MAG: SDR family NAD(P)-dependent oxidoreductase, partial [Thiotrichales bacterium]|nr:SDR family NAD(P)-dependent oxidoreductase [Thiotrichales bacterium]